MSNHVRLSKEFVEPMSVVIPPHQPIPFPLPLWLVDVLLIVGFVLHVIPMNIAWMGGFVSGVQLLQKKSNFANRFGKQLALSLPVILSFAITQGIVPLLFLQLEYGPLYYTSSILMAVPWLLQLVVLMAGYYGLYWFKYKFEKLGSWGPLLLMAISTLFTLIAFVFTNNMTLMLHPEKWSSVLADYPYGLYLTMNPTLIARLSHSVLGALAITGLAMGCFGLYYVKREAEYGAWLIRQGSGVFLIATVLNILMGFIFLSLLPSEIQHGLQGGFLPATITLHTGYLLSILAVVCNLFSWKMGKPGYFKVGLIFSALTLLDMALLRHWVRTLSVQSVFHPETVSVSIQWDLFIAFLILTVGLLIYLVWLTKTAFSAVDSVKVPDYSLQG